MDPKRGSLCDGLKGAPKGTNAGIMLSKHFRNLAAACKGAYAGTVVAKIVVRLIKVAAENRLLDSSCEQNPKPYNPKPAAFIVTFRGSGLQWVRVAGRSCEVPRPCNPTQPHQSLHLLILRKKSGNRLPIYIYITNSNLYHVIMIIVDKPRRISSHIPYYFFNNQKEPHHPLQQIRRMESTWPTTARGQTFTAPRLSHQGWAFLSRPLGFFLMASIGDPK